jgi:hypothetical protein
MWTGHVPMAAEREVMGSLQPGSVQNTLHKGNNWRFGGEHQHYGRTCANAVQHPLAIMASPEYAHHFSVRNVPFGIASSTSHSNPQAVTRLGNSVIFLNDCHNAGLFDGVEGLPRGVLARETLNDFAALPKPIHRQVRQVIQDACKNGDVSKFPPGSVENITEVQMHLPVRVGDFAGTAPFSSPREALSLTASRLFLLPGARQERRPHHHQRRTPAPGLLQLPHRLPGAGQLRRRVRDRRGAADGPVPGQERSRPC